MAKRTRRELKRAIAVLADANAQLIIQAGEQEERVRQLEDVASTLSQLRAIVFPVERRLSEHGEVPLRHTVSRVAAELHALNDRMLWPSSSLKTATAPKPEWMLVGKSTAIVSSDAEPPEPTAENSTIEEPPREPRFRLDHYPWRVKGGKLRVSTRYVEAHPDERVDLLWDPRPGYNPIVPIPGPDELDV